MNRGVKWGLLGLGACILLGLGFLGYQALTTPKPAATVLDRIAPTITLDNLSDGQTLSDGFVIKVTAKDNKQVRNVEYYLDDRLAKTTYASPFGVTWSNSGVTAGDHVLRVKVYDTSGNAASVQVKVVVTETVAAPVSVVPGPVASSAPTAIVATAKVTPKPKVTTSKPKTPTATPATPGATPTPTPPTPTPTPVPSVDPPGTPTGLQVSYDAASRGINMSWTAPAAGPVTSYTVVRDGATLGTVTSLRFTDYRNNLGNTYSYQVVASNSGGSSAATLPVAITLAPDSVFGAMAMAATDTSDPTPVEVGMKFRSRVAGKLTGIRIYRGPGDVGAHTVSLWTSGGALMATAAAAPAAANGWENVFFATPVALTPDATYVASYFAPGQNLSYTVNLYGSTYRSDTLLGLAYGVDGANGVYKVGAGFPTTPSNNSTGYGVDVAFAPDTPAPQVLAGKFSDYYAQWSHGPSSSENVFPTGIWLQWAGRQHGGVSNGTTYQSLGIQTDIGLYGWPGDDLQFQSITDTNWRAFTNPTTHADRSVLDGLQTVLSDPRGDKITGYVLEDEADMRMTGAPGDNLVSTVVEAYGNTVRAADPTRPVYANFGKPMSIDGWFYGPIETGTELSDFKHYCNAADIVSADYYGLTDPGEDVDYHGPWTYGQVIKNMRKYCGDTKPIWGFVETAQPTAGSADKPTPAEYEAAVWNMVTQDANGLLIFAHTFFGTFSEDAWLDDLLMVAKVTEVNTRLQSLAPILNQPTVKYAAGGSTSNADVPLNVLVKTYNGSTYVLAQAGGSRAANNSANVTGTITANTAAATAIVVGESRTVPIVNGQIIDSFAAYGFHVYQF